MKITKENYGLFVIDYFDGNLSEKEQEVLLRFLKEHPELQEEVEHIKKAYLTVPETTFPEKEKLKQPEIIAVAEIGEHNYEEFLLLSLDHELAPEEEENLALFLEKNPQLKTEKEVFLQTKLVPDTSITYRSKAQLKQRFTLSPTVWISSVAAVLVLILGWNLFFKSRTPIKHNHPVLAVFELHPQSLSLQVNSTAPELLPGPRFLKKPQHATTPAYVRNPVLIAQLPKRFAQEKLIPMANPNIIPVNIIPENAQGIMAAKKPEKKKGHFLLALLEGGVKAVNFVTNKDVLLVKTYNQQGQLIHYQILSDNFNFDKQFKDKK